MTGGINRILISLDFRFIIVFIVNVVVVLFFFTFALFKTKPWWPISRLLHEMSKIKQMTLPYLHSICEYYFRARRRLKMAHDKGLHFMKIYNFAVASFTTCAARGLAAAGSCARPQWQLLVPQQLVGQLLLASYTTPRLSQPLFFFPFCVRSLGLKRPKTGKDLDLGPEVDCVFYIEDTWGVMAACAK